MITSKECEHNFVVWRVYFGVSVWATSECGCGIRIVNAINRVPACSGLEVRLDLVNSKPEQVELF